MAVGKARVADDEMGGKESTEGMRGGTSEARCSYHIGVSDKSALGVGPTAGIQRSLLPTPPLFQWHATANSDNVPHSQFLSSWPYQRSLHCRPSTKSLVEKPEFFDGSVEAEAC